MYLTDDAMLCDDRDIEAGRCTIKTREGRVKASVPSRERRVPCPSEYNVSQQARFGTMWSSSQPSMLEGHGGVGKRLPSTCSDSIKWLTTEPQGSRSATVPQLKVSINTQFAKWGEGHPKEATFSVSTPFKRPVMPEGYEVGLIDIELVTKENSPSRLNHITTGQHEKAKNLLRLVRLVIKSPLSSGYYSDPIPKGTGGVDDHVEVLRIMIHLVGSPGGSPLDLLSRLKTNLSGSTATQWWKITMPKALEAGEHLYPCSEPLLDIRFRWEVWNLGFPAK